MNLIDKTPKVDRRSFMATTGAAALVISANAVMCPTEAWAVEAKNLKPETVRTLIKMARDIYPHDRLADRFYAVAVKGLDGKSTEGAPLKTQLEEGVAKLDAAAKAAHGVGYADVGWEHQRVALLRAIEKDGFFQAVRGDLVVSLYNQKELWPSFGYEGESASKGGYIKRGFDDIAWL
ncbi:MAG: gluconate 2-dehydrogenase subunit 3 family protein [Hyphomicrobium sp.]